MNKVKSYFCDEDISKEVSSRLAFEPTWYNLWNKDRSWILSIKRNDETWKDVFIHLSRIMKEKQA